jgi:hypothetical protein
MERYSNLTNVNFGIMKSEGWKCALTDLPSPSSYRDVLVIMEKHGGDCSVEFAGWCPTNNYTQGYFSEPNSQNKIEKVIYLYRELDFII